MSTTEETGPAEAKQPDGLPFDPDALREKYRAERERRLRDDGNEQYLEVAGRYAHYLDDPYVAPGFTRSPLTDDVGIAVIGGGFGGLLAGARLRQAGFESIRMIDPAGDFGGTWYWNRYPGIACDIESYTYLPLLEEVGYVPKEKYSYGAEILAHSQAIARKFDLYRDACFQTRVEALRWDDDEARWIISTNHGDRMRAHYVCLATGPLNRPKLPGIPGIDDFQGHSFHASRWDYDYTGGNSEGGLTGLRGVRVGIIGTGATSVQVVPHLGEWAEHLYVFQRTPSSIDVKDNPPTDREWAKALEQGWHQRRMDNFNNLVSGVPQEEDMVNDGWTALIGKLLVSLRQGRTDDFSPQGLARAVELADFEKMEEIRARVDAIVDDPATAEALKPYYRQFCKRPCFHNEYLETFNRPNVTLVDTHGKGVERITAKGRGGRRARVRGRLSHLRQRLRSRHRLLTPCGFPGHRPRWQEFDREVDGRRADAARHARARVSQLLHHEQRAGRLHRQLPAPAQRTSQTHRLHHRDRCRARCPRCRGVGSGRSGMGGDVHRQSQPRPRLLRDLHAGLLQQRGKTRRTQRARRLLRRRLGGVLSFPRSLAKPRRTEGPRSAQVSSVITARSARSSLQRI
jgi:cation diffusion facilitator CzcD-associated flavoprotein CzcO